MAASPIAESTDFIPFELRHGYPASDITAPSVEPEVLDEAPFRAEIDEIASRVTPVRIGGHDGVLRWADPDADGSRPHHLQWGEGPCSWTLIGIRQPEEIVALARGLVCGDA